MPRTTNRPAVTVSLIAYNPTTNRVERIVHCGKVSSPATAREMLKLTRRALREQSTRIAF